MLLAAGNPVVQQVQAASEKNQRPRQSYNFKQRPKEDEPRWRHINWERPPIECSANGCLTHFLSA